MTDKPIASPCIRVCAVDARTGWCIGCGRTMAEIGGWIQLGPEGRAKTLSLLPARMDTLAKAGKPGAQTA